MSVQGGLNSGPQTPMGRPDVGDAGHVLGDDRGPHRLDPFDDDVVHRIVREHPHVDQDLRCLAIAVG